jgi:hypothetical protein
MDPLPRPITNAFQQKHILPCMGKQKSVAAEQMEGLLPKERHSAVILKAQTGGPVEHSIIADDEVQSVKRINVLKALDGGNYLVYYVSSIYH